MTPARRTAPPAGAHLVEVGVQWPPESFLRRKLEGLAAAGLRVTVASPAAPRHARTAVGGVRLLRLRAEDGGWLAARVRVLGYAARLLIRDPGALRRTFTAVRQADRGKPRRRRLDLLANCLAILLARPDVVHFEWESAAVRFLPLFEACGRPVLVSARGSGVRVNPHAGYGHLARAYPAVFARAAAVHCVSEAVRGDAMRFGLDGAKTRVIRPAVDTEYFAPASRTSGHEVFRIVAVGQLNWIKGYDDALEAVALLVGDGVEVSYEILGGEPGPDSGKPSDRGRLLYLVNDLGLQDRVTLRGEVSDDVVRERLRAADVLLHASLSEGLPNAVLEAMACALPVVVTDCGGVPEAVQHRVHGLVCPRRSPQALADALHTLRRDPELARGLGEAGRARVCAEFPLPRQIDGFRRLYAEVLCAGSRSTRMKRRLPPAPGSIESTRSIVTGTPPR